MKEFQKFPISNFRVGFDESVEPWLLPREAFQILKNAHVYRGVLEKISGYDVYARMSYRETIVLTPVPDAITTTFTGTLNHAPTTTNFRGEASINDLGTLSEVFSYQNDASSTVINLQSNAGGTGTLDLGTLLVTLNFNTAPAVMGGYNRVLFSYDFAPVPGSYDPDIMGIKPYYAQNGDQEVLIFNTRRMGKIVTLEGVIAATEGTDNGVSEIGHILQVEGATHAPAFNGAVVTFTGTIAGAPLIPGSITFRLYSNTPALRETITDNGIGLLTGTLTTTGFINYATGAWTITFDAATTPAATDTLNSEAAVYGDVFTGDFTDFFSVANYTFKAFITNNVDYIRYYDGRFLFFLNTSLASRPGDLNYEITRCLFVSAQRERLLLFAPVESGVPVPNGIFWSTAGDPLDFTNDEQLLAPTSESIISFGVINSDVVVRFNNSERVFRYTGDAFSPFRWDTTNSIWRTDASFSSINYDSYFTAVGKTAITASDGVNIKRNDEIIPDFTLNNRILQEGPIISIAQPSITQCYGERFDEFKEGWLCFKRYTPDSNELTRSDSVLSFNYLDETYAVYTFPFNVLGYGKVTSQDTWGNNFDPWEDANYAWESFYESFNAVLNLAGDRYGVVYKLGNTNTLVDENGDEQPVLMDVISKNFNPFIEDGELCRLGYIDLFVSSNAQTRLRVQVYRDDTLYEAPDGNPAGAYFETTLTFTPTDSMSSVVQTKVWKRVYVNGVAREHTIRLYQNEDDFADDLNQPVRIHAMVLWMKPAGRLFN